MSPKKANGFFGGYFLGKVYGNVPQKGEIRGGGMLTIMELKAREDGGHGLQSQSHRTECWLEGWVAVPEELAEKVWSCGGYCEPVLEEGRLVDVVPGQRPEEAAPEPTAEERLRADVDFLAAVTGVEL